MTKNVIEKKKILYIVESMAGGVFTYISNLSNELIEEYDIYIAYGIREQTPLNFRSSFDSRVHFIEVQNFQRSINPVKDIRALFEIKKIAKVIIPDIIHLHSSKAGALGRIAFNGKRTPVFYTPHGYSFLMEDHSFLKRSLYKIIEFICGRRNSTTISCGEGEHSESIKLTNKTAYINNGINIMELQKLVNSEEKIPSPPGPFTVVTLAQIYFPKNPRLFNQIATEMPELDFIWIGDGELRAELTAPNIKITGLLERKRALKYLLQADVFLSTSLWEGLSFSLLEAMHMKKLCIVSNIAGNRYVIRDGENGFVCNNAKEFVDAIKTAQVEDLSHLTEKAYKEILDVYNTVVMSKKYKEIYQKSIS